MTLAQLLKAQDTSIVLMFGGVASFVLNWYVWTSARARRIMTLVPLLACAIVLVMEMTQR